MAIRQAETQNIINYTKVDENLSSSNFESEEEELLFKVDSASFKDDILRIS